MEPTKTTIGVCTKATTQRLLNSSSSSSSASCSPDIISPPSSLCYLQLRSRRRLLRPAFVAVVGPEPKEEEREEREVVEFSVCGVDEEASFGVHCFHSLLPIDSGNIRENTPCSLIRDSEAIRTPGTTTRKTSSTSADRRVRIETQRNIPTTFELEEFFALAERQQQRLFMEKYNFDVVNDLPLPGRYEWFQVVQ